MAALSKGDLIQTLHRRLTRSKLLFAIHLLATAVLRNLSRRAASTQGLALAAAEYRNSPDRNSLLTTKWNRRYIAGFFERFNPIEISGC
jgi:hypothetical protein